MGVELIAGAIGTIGTALGSAGTAAAISTGGALIAQNVANNETRYRAAVASGDIEEANRLAAEIQKESAGTSVGELTSAGEKASAEFSPYTEAGALAVEQLKSASGLPSTAIFNPETSAAYRLRERQGTEAINRQLASKGLSGSKTSMKSNREFITGLTADETNQQISRLQNLANLGFTGAQGRANILTGTASNVANVRSGLATNLSGLTTATAAQKANYQAQLSQLTQSTASDIAGAGANIVNAMNMQDLYSRFFPKKVATTTATTTTEKGAF